MKRQVVHSIPNFDCPATQVQSCVLRQGFHEVFPLFKVKLPWRSASIELLTNGELSEASDVWSFGVTAWEIFTFGQSPYAGMRYSHQFIRYLEQGNRLAQPQEASEKMLVDIAISRVLQRFSWKLINSVEFF